MTLSTPPHPEDGVRMCRCTCLSKSAHTTMKVECADVVILNKDELLARERRGLLREVRDVERVGREVAGS